MRTHGLITEGSSTRSLIDHIGKGRGREGKRKGCVVTHAFHLKVEAGVAVSGSVTGPREVRQRCMAATAAEFGGGH